MTLSPDEFEHTLLSLESGELLARRYRLIRELGRGGMGVVWLAEDAKLDDLQVAIKVLPAALTMNARAVARLKKEATTCLGLTHPHIVRLLTFEQDDSRGGLAFLVMQYIEGKTLDEMLVEFPDGIPLERVGKWAAQLAQALDFAHSKRVLHRDIKPSNVMIDGDDNAFLMDFGIAREVKETMTRVTGRDSSGTLPYMSPQQLRGQNNEANDIYSLAALLYEAISGEPPFTTGDLQHQILRETPATIQGKPDHVNDALLGGLAKEGEARPGSAVALAEAFLGQSKLAEAPGRGGSRGRTPLVAGALLLVVAIAVALAFLRPWAGDHPIDDDLPVTARDDGRDSPGKESAGPSSNELEMEDTELPVEPAVPAVVLSDVVPVRSQAKILCDEVKELDGGQGFDHRIRELKITLDMAEEFYNRDGFGDALEHYGQVVDGCEELKSDNAGLLTYAGL